jgi:hypothetical protein
VDDYLAAYRRTPHSATGAAPAQLLFGRQINDIIPGIRLKEPASDEATRVAERDARAKEQMKRCADRRTKVAEHTIQMGDQVLRRRSQRTKTDTFFETEPWKVTGVRRDSLELTRDGQQCMRHVTHVRRIQQQTDTVTIDETEDSDKATSVEEQRQSEIENGEQGGAEGRTRHQRQAKQGEKNYKEPDLRKAL